MCIGVLVWLICASSRLLLLEELANDPKAVTLKELCGAVLFGLPGGHCLLVHVSLTAIWVGFLVLVWWNCDACMIMWAAACGCVRCIQRCQC
jgi:hypothetical protein